MEQFVQLKRFERIVTFTIATRSDLTFYFLVTKLSLNRILIIGNQHLKSSIHLSMHIIFASILWSNISTKILSSIGKLVRFLSMHFLYESCTSSFYSAILTTARIFYVQLELKIFRIFKLEDIVDLWTRRHRIFNSTDFWEAKLDFPKCRHVLNKIQGKCCYKILYHKVRQSCEIIFKAYGIVSYIKIYYSLLNQQFINMNLLMLDFRFLQARFRTHFREDDFNCTAVKDMHWTSQQ